MRDLKFCQKRMSFFNQKDQEVHAHATRSLTKSSFSKNLNMVGKKSGYKFCRPQSRLQNILFHFRKYCIYSKFSEADMYKVEINVFF